MSVPDLFRLDGKLALATGRHRGIKPAVAESPASAGADAAGVSRSLEAEGSEAERPTGRIIFLASPLSFQCGILASARLAGAAVFLASPAPDSVHGGWLASETGPGV
jgi:hypothetical protein